MKKRLLNSIGNSGIKHKSGENVTDSSLEEFEPLTEPDNDSLDEIINMNCLPFDNDLREKFLYYRMKFDKFYEENIKKQRNQLNVEGYKPSLTFEIDENLGEVKNENSKITPHMTLENLTNEKNNISISITKEEQEFFSFFVNFYANNSQFSDYKDYYLNLIKQIDHFMDDFNGNTELVKKIVSNKNKYLKKYTREVILEKHENYKKLNPNDSSSDCSEIDEEERKQFEECRMKNTTDQKGSGTEFKRIVCPINKCDKVYSSRKSLNVHIKKHHLFEKYQCQWCQREFTSKQNYKNHIQKKHQGSKTENINQKKGKRIDKSKE